MNNLLNKRKTYLITLKNNSKKMSNYKKLGFKIILIDSLENKEDINKLCKKYIKLATLEYLLSLD